MHDIVSRPGDTCPACRAETVVEGVRTESHGGPVFIDGCATCQALWERETRKRSCDEPCSNCALLPGSPEMESGEIWTIMRNCLEGPGIFYCHRRVPFGLSDGNKSFQHERNAAGTRVTNASVCAGWIRAKLKEKRSIGAEMREAAE